MRKKEYMSEMEFISIFSDNLRDVMFENNISQSELARESGLTRASISRYLNGQRMPTIKAIVNLCYALNCTYEDLLPDYSLVD